MQLNFSLRLLYCKLFLFPVFFVCNAICWPKDHSLRMQFDERLIFEAKNCPVISKMLIQPLQTFQFGKKLAVILAMKMLNQSWESRTCLSRCDITRLQPPWPRCDYGIYAIKLCGLNFLFLYSARRGFFLVNLCSFFLSFHLKLTFDCYIIVYVYESR